MMNKLSFIIDILLSSVVMIYLVVTVFIVCFEVEVNIKSICNELVLGQPMYI